MARGGAPSWTSEKLVTCDSGHYAGQWFTLTEWEHRLRATARMQELTPDRPAPCLEYKRTTRTADHPTHPYVTAQVWTTTR